MSTHITLNLDGNYVNNTAIEQVLDTIRQRVFIDGEKISIQSTTYMNIVNKLESEFNSWINTLKIMQDNFEITRKESYELGLNKQKGRTEEQRKQNIQAAIQKNYDVTKYQTQLDLLLEHLKKGYKLIHKTREAFTNQDIKYRLLDSDTHGNLFERIYTLDEVLQLTTISYEKSEEIIQNGIQKITKFKINVNSLKKMNNVTLEGEETYYKFGSKLYKQLVKEFYSLQKDTEDEKNFFNLGHIYEVYVYLTDTKKFKDRALRSFSKDSKEHKSYALIHGALLAARNSTPGIAGGDQAGYNKDKELQSQQLKNVSKNAAGLINSTTIVNTMNTIISALKSKNPSEELAKLFSQDIQEDKGELTHKLERTMNNQVTNSLKQAFTKLT